MADKVIDLDPTKRISKEALAHIKKLVEGLRVEDINSLTVMYTPTEGAPSIHVYGLDFASLGMLQAFINASGQDLLSADFHSF